MTDKEIIKLLTDIHLLQCEQLEVSKQSLDRYTKNQDRMARYLKAFVVFSLLLIALPVLVAVFEILGFMGSAI